MENDSKSPKKPENRFDQEQLKAYVAELTSVIIEREKETGMRLTKNKISVLKNQVAKNYNMMKPPRDMDILLMATPKQYNQLLHLRAKPTRSLSGVAIIAVMTKPHRCPHGKCTFCPGGVNSYYGDTPQSYTGYEPSTRRAIRNEYDPFRIVWNRLQQYILSGHNPTKVDCIIMGGTFPAFPKEYQYDVAIRIFAAMNSFAELFYTGFDLDFAKFKSWFELPHDPDDPNVSPRIMEKMKKVSDETIASLYEQFPDKKECLEHVKHINETASIRCIGMTEETKPDWALLDHGNAMLELGTTRVEVGVQSLYDDVLLTSHRGHTLQHAIDSTQILRDLGFKINYHMMTGMPGSDEEKDVRSLIDIFEDDRFRPDMIKIYPCLVMPGTALYLQYKRGEYVPYTLERAVKIIGEAMAKVPEYCRIMRIQRDIPSTMVLDGVKHTNLKQYVEEYMKEKGLVCRDVRAREIARVDPKSITKTPVFEIVVREYVASGGKEFFISAEDTANDVLIGFCRLRFINQVLRDEFTKDSAIVRELHVYGSALNVGQKDANYAEVTGQHKGWGKKLMAKAEEICKEHQKDKLLVISGVGVREYYWKLGYENDGPYVSKKF